MKIIFLDIDGVLATDESSKLLWHEEFLYPFDATCVSIFNRILDKTSAEIVLSSDWRIPFQDLNLLDRLFKHNGINRSPIAVTADFGKNRSKEISSYIQKHSSKITSILILDDMDLKIRPKNFIKCSIEYGLNQPGIEEKAIAILNSDQNNLQT